MNPLFYGKDIRDLVKFLGEMPINHLGNTPFHTNQKLEVLELMWLIKSFRECIHWPNKFGATAIFRCKSIDKAMWLVEHGSNVSLSDKTLSDNTLSDNNGVCLVNYYADLDIIRYLVRAGARKSIGRIPERKGMSEQDWFTIADYMLSDEDGFKADVNECDLTKITDIKKIKYLLKRGANPNHQNLDGDTLLHLSNNIPIVQLVLSKGGDVNQRNSKLETPLMLSTNYQKTCLLLSHGANIYKTDLCERTVLHHLVQNYKDTEEQEFEKILKLLVKNKSGAHVNARDIDGITPLYLANSPKVVNLLIVNGAKVNSKNKKGDTPLHCLAIDPVIARILVCSGADVNAKNSLGKTPILRCLNNSDTTGYLIEFGAVFDRQTLEWLSNNDVSFVSFFGPEKFNWHCRRSFMNVHYQYRRHLNSQQFWKMSGKEVPEEALLLKKNKKFMGDLIHMPYRSRALTCYDIVREICMFL